MYQHKHPHIVTHTHTGQTHVSSHTSTQASAHRHSNILENSSHRFCTECAHRHTRTHTLSHTHAHTHNTHTQGKSKEVLNPPKAHKFSDKSASPNYLKTTTNLTVGARDVWLSHFHDLTLRQLTCTALLCRVLHTVP